MNLKYFLKEPEVQELLEQNNLIQVYRLWLEDDHPNATLTRFFLDNNINPLDYLTEIPKGAFSHLDITSIVIPHNVTDIENAVFSYCDKLNSITIPNTIETIGDAAFFNCYNLKTIIYEGTEEQVTNINIGLFNEWLQKADWIYKG